MADVANQHVRFELLDQVNGFFYEQAVVTSASLPANARLTNSRPSVVIDHRMRKPLSTMWDYSITFRDGSSDASIQ